MYIKDTFGDFNTVIRVAFRNFPRCRLLKADEDDKTMVFRVVLYTLNTQEMHVTLKESYRDFNSSQEREKWWIEFRLGKLEKDV